MDPLTPCLWTPAEIRATIGFVGIPFFTVLVGLWVAKHKGWPWPLKDGPFPRWTGSQK